MSTFNEKKWLDDGRLIARRLGSEDLPGLLKKYLKVPPLCKALVAMPKGKKVVKPEGSEVSGLAGATLVKTRKFDLDFTAHGLVTAEGYVSDCRLLLTFMAGETDFDIEQVAENLLKGKNRVRADDIHTFLGEGVEQVLRTFVSQRNADRICEMPVLADLRETLETGLKKQLYLGGLTFCALARLDFNCPEFEQLQQERSKIKGREEALRSRSKLDELEMQKRLEHIEALKAVGVDPNVAAEIELGKAHFTASRAKLLLVASGKGATTYVPYSKEPATPDELYLLPENMGFARSAIILERAGEPVVAVGAQRGVYLVSVQGSYSAEFYIETSGRPRGGFNSVALAGGTVYASHSELGLLSWESEEEPGRPVFPKISRAGKFTRGVCVHKQIVYFSSGTQVYAFEPGSSEIKAVYRDGHAPITALLVAGDSIFAGDQDGEVLHWPIEYPHQAAKVLLRRQGTIYSVGKMNTDKGRFILIGARDYSVTAFDPLSGVVRQYMSPDFLRWVDGAGDFVFASSYSGHRIFFWDIDHTARHLYSIPVDEMAQDIYVWEEDQE